MKPDVVKSLAIAVSCRVCGANGYGTVAFCPFCSAAVFNGQADKTLDARTADVISGTVGITPNGQPLTEPAPGPVTKGLGRFMTASVVRRSESGGTSGRVDNSPIAAVTPAASGVIGKPAIAPVPTSAAPAAALAGVSDSGRPVIAPLAVSGGALQHYAKKLGIGAIVLLVLTGIGIRYSETHAPKTPVSTISNRAASPPPVDGNAPGTSPATECAKVDESAGLCSNKH